MRIIILVCLLLSTEISFSQELKAFQIFDKQGNVVSFGNMIKKLNKSQVILFGELHNNSIGHWLQLETAQSLIEENELMCLGAEMYEADNQLILNEYLSGLISEKQLEDEAKVWNNHKTDYLPLLNFAKENNLPFIATNIPRRYASLIYKKGPDALNDLDSSALEFMAPLPIEVDFSLPSYAEMRTSMGGHMSQESAMDNLISSQASKDASMAWQISESLMDKGIFLHFNGTYHSKDFEGISYYLNLYQPKVKIATIHMVEQENIETLEEVNSGRADFTIAIPSDMTKTY